MKNVKIKVNFEERKITKDEIENTVAALAGDDCGNNDKVLITAILMQVARGKPLQFDG